MHENVLVVEDNALDRKIICSLLEKKHYIPIESCDAFEALEYIDEKKIDLILLDIKLPRCNGFELLKRLGNYSLREGVPIIMMSANRLDKAGVMQSFKYGASDFLVKPIQAEALYEKIDKLKLGEKLKKQLKVEIPDKRPVNLQFQAEMLTMEEHGITVSTFSPMPVDEVLVLYSPFFAEYGVVELELRVKSSEIVDDLSHQFLLFVDNDLGKMEKIKAIYSSLLDQSKKDHQINFRGES